MRQLVYCSKCENKEVFATGICKSCYNKQYWESADEQRLRKRREAVKSAQRKMREEGYIPKALRTKQTRAEKNARAVVCNRKRKLKRRKILDEIKLKSGCVDCGYRKRAIALDFDHVRGVKTFNIARAMGEMRPFELILEEVMKCDVRCANCHRVVTEDRKNKEE